jgi:predicted permease
VDGFDEFDESEGAMVTSGVAALFGLTVMGIALAFMFKRFGTSGGFLASSGLPAASLLVAFAFRDQLGRSILAVAIVVAIVSVAMVGTGIMLTARARREGSGKSARLAMATVLASTPLLLGLVAMCRSRVV